jgi:hypothetical protein
MASRPDALWNGFFHAALVVQQCRLHPLSDRGGGLAGDALDPRR